MINTNNQLIEITNVGLNDATYGESINDRFTNIQHNFREVVNSKEYFTGADGGSLDVITCQLIKGSNEVINIKYNDDFLTHGSLYDIVADAIISKASSKDLHAIENTGRVAWDDDLNGINVQLVCKTYQKEKHVVSILPFIYIDSRFRNLSDANTDSSEYLGKEDVSCSIYAKINSDNILVFETYQTFPTIYWDNSNTGGEFCWKINGSPTGLSCKGPNGMDGKSMSLYIALISPTSSILNNEEELAPDEKGSVYELYAIMGYFPQSQNEFGEIKYQYEVVRPVNFADRGIVLDTGLNVIAFPSIYNEENGHYELVGDVDNTDVSAKCFISSVFKENKFNAETNSYDTKYWVSSGIEGAGLPPFQVLNHACLRELLNTIPIDNEGVNSPKIRGIYIPYAKDNQENGLYVTSKAHMLWNESGQLVLGPYSNIFEATGLDSTKNMDIRYTNTKCKNLQVSGIESISGTLDVTGSANLRSNTSISGTLDVTGVADLKNNTSISGTLDVTGVADLKNNTSISGTLDVTGPANLRNNTSISGTLDVTGSANLRSNTSISGTLDITGPANLRNNTSISGALDVTGPASLRNNTSISGTLDVTGNTTSGSLNVSNNATIKSLNVSDSAEIGSLSVGGDTTIGGNLSVSGNETIQGTLNVTDTAALNNSMVVAGDIVLHGKEGSDPRFKMPRNDNDDILYITSDLVNINVPTSINPELSTSTLNASRINNNEAYIIDAHSDNVYTDNVYTGNIQYPDQDKVICVGDMLYVSHDKSVGAMLDEYLGKPYDDSTGSGGSITSQQRKKYKFSIPKLQGAPSYYGYTGDDDYWKEKNLESSRTGYLGYLGQTTDGQLVPIHEFNLNDHEGSISATGDKFYPYHYLYIPSSTYFKTDGAQTKGIQVSYKIKCQIEAVYEHRTSSNNPIKYTVDKDYSYTFDKGSGSGIGYFDKSDRGYTLNNSFIIDLRDVFIPLLTDKKDQYKYPKVTLKLAVTYTASDKQSSFESIGKITVQRVFHSKSLIGGATIKKSTSTWNPQWSNSGSYIGDTTKYEGHYAVLENASWTSAVEINETAELTYVTTFISGGDGSGSSSNSSLGKTILAIGPDGVYYGGINTGYLIHFKDNAFIGETVSGSNRPTGK